MTSMRLEYESEPLVSTNSFYSYFPPKNNKKRYSILDMVGLKFELHNLVEKKKNINVTNIDASPK